LPDFVLREVFDALPIAYEFTDLEQTRYSASLRMPGHYVGVPAAQR